VARRQQLTAGATAALGALVFALGAPGPWQAAAGVVVGAASGWLSVVDAATHRLPDRILAAALLGTVPFMVVGATVTGEPAVLLRALLAALALGALLAAVALLSRGGLGSGDVKLGALLGLWAGWLGPGVPAVLAVVASIAGGLVALVAIARGATGRTRIPFGPMLAAGAAAATWWPVS